MNDTSLIEPEMPKAYNPQSVEGKWYKYWLEKDYFKPVINPKKKPFTIERDRRITYGTRSNGCGRRCHDPVAPHERRPYFMAAGGRPCQYRRTGSRRKITGQRRYRPLSGGQRKVPRTDVAMD